METKQCSRCKQAFGCRSDGRGCWCESVKLSPERLAELREKYDNCLCPGCLALFSEEK